PVPASCRWLVRTVCVGRALRLNLARTMGCTHHDDVTHRRGTQRPTKRSFEIRVPDLPLASARLDPYEIGIWPRRIAVLLRAAMLKKPSDQGIAVRRIGWPIDARWRFASAD